MTLNPATETRDWWDNLISLHPPKDEAVARTMDVVRSEFRDLGFTLIEELPPGPDLTVALRALKKAANDAIGAIACNQDHWED